MDGFGVIYLQSSVCLEDTKTLQNLARSQVLTALDLRIFHYHGFYGFIHTYIYNLEFSSS
ncbi:hypothetical protein LguiB_006298 [Lonicera macranthoides]